MQFSWRRTQGQSLFQFGQRVGRPEAFRIMQVLATNQLGAKLQCDELGLNDGPEGTVLIVKWT
jgi:hypothetical protein